MSALPALAASPSQLPEWTVAERPTIDIGGREGDPGQELFRVAGAIALADGRIAVADGSNEIRIYGPDGALQSRTGGQGSGPGEYQIIRRFARFGPDSIIVYDAGSRRISVLDGDASFARSFVLQRPPDTNGASLSGVLGDGLLVTGLVATIAQTGSYHGTVPLFYYDAAGDFVNKIGEFPGADQYRPPRQPSAGPGVARVVPRLPFGRELRYVAARDRVYIGRNDAYELVAYDHSGSEVNRVRRDFEPVPVGAADVLAFARAETSGVTDPAERERRIQAYQAMPVPETLPAFDKVSIDRMGNLWVQDYPRPGSERSTWTVFDGSGGAIATVRMPATFTPLDIADDYMIILWRDEFDVEHVRLHALRR